jgi:hypothetical protein
MASISPECVGRSKELELDFDVDIGLTSARRVGSTSAGKTDNPKVEVGNERRADAPARDFNQSSLQMKQNRVFCR